MVLVVRALCIDSYFTEAVAATTAAVLSLQLARAVVQGTALLVRLAIDDFLLADSCFDFIIQDNHFHPVIFSR